MASKDAGTPTLDPGLDVGALEQWLRQMHPDLMGEQSLSAHLLTGGRSNLTYRLDGGPRPLVLRRPPLAHVQATAHDMRREYVVQAALVGSAVPVATPLALCEDTAAPAGVGAPFYLMDHVAGHVLATPAQNARYSPAQLHAVGLELAGVLATLHDIDPARVGLGDFGRPLGFLPRQLHRWGLQLAGSRRRELPDLEALARELGVSVPATSSTGIVHGDYRLDNAVVGERDGHLHIAAVLDWEMATLGDTASDLGMLGLYWGLPAIAEQAGTPSVGAVDVAAGYPSFPEMLDAYGALRGNSVTQPWWYLAFAAYKLAVILEGVHHRWTLGATVGDGFETIGELVEPLARAGRRTLAARATTLLP